MNKNIKIVRSETWLRGDLESIQSVLDDAIKEFVSEPDEIINVEKHTEDNGLSRFWIYVKQSISESEEPDWKKKTYRPPMDMINSYKSIVVKVLTTKDEEFYAYFHFPGGYWINSETGTIIEDVFDWRYTTK